MLTQAGTLQVILCLACRWTIHVKYEVKTGHNQGNLREFASCM